MNTTRRGLILQTEIIDGTLDGDPLGSNDLLGTSDGTKGSVLDGYLDGILLGAEPGPVDGCKLGSNDGLLLGPW